MANNKIIVSSGNGTYQETTSSFSIDNDNGIISASSAVVATSSLPTNVSGVLQVYKGKVIPLWFTSSIWQNYDNDNNQLTTFDGAFGANLSGTLFQYRNDIPTTIDGKDYNGIGPHRVASASFNGDIIGTVSASIPVKIISVANVTGGILDSRFGGTGTSSFENGAIVTLSGSGFKPSDGANNVIATDANNNWSMVDKASIEPNFAQLTGAVVYLFTGSVGTSSASSSVFNNWLPPTGTRFVRVICQGGGGGGGSGNRSSNNTFTYGGNGGSGGGYSDATFNADIFINPVTIVAGYGGYRGAGIGENGSNGGSSSFGDYIFGYGGIGGTAGQTDPQTVSRGSGGYIQMGGDGGKGRNSSNSTAGETLTTRYGAPGGGGGGGNVTTGNSNGTAGGGLSGISGGTGGSVDPFHGSDGNDSYFFYFNKYYLNGTSSSDIQIANFPKLLCTGGGGGAGVGSSAIKNAGNGGSASFGAGGGGSGGKNTTAPSTGLFNGIGGNGGKGYVLIICT